MEDAITMDNIKGHTIESLSMIYANLITLDVDVVETNKIILSKYKLSGLERIKEKAWKMIEDADKAPKFY